MKMFLLYLLGFANFWWLPLVAMFIIAIIIEQVVVRTTESEVAIIRAMKFRRFLWQQNVFINIVWLVCFTCLNIMFSREAAQSAPLGGSDLMWR